MRVYQPFQKNFQEVPPLSVKSLDDDGELSKTPKGDKMIISHKYNDLAWITENDASKVFPSQGSGMKDAVEGAKKKRRNNKKLSSRGGVAEPFPLKLHRMLDTVEVQGLSHIVSWRPHGRAFLVHNTKAFVDLVLPQFSKQKKINSFHRQLQLYGFMRITRGPDSGAYYHERFLIGRQYLCRSMYRTKVKGLFQKPIIDPNTEPNFYAMPHLKRPTNNTKLLPFEISADDSCDSSLREPNACLEGPSEKIAERPFESQMCITRASNPVSPSVYSVPRQTKLLQMATNHLRNMGHSKHLSSLEENSVHIEPLSWRPSVSNKKSRMPRKEQDGSIGTDLSQFSSTGSILQRFLLNN
eukprot:CAMPEP_0185730862 /NCGR_PEP_ID=MMETSP1171-20130828/11206_1 /TAXON_ID=374046 /ORGANISM="Helicotheca tamensis, Strain CCMP826" /LENGTH=353 /DNA_ID=CAMNT_0028400003 /DNA_START=11 /DNA_END=1072 /DNA_ORIENTATION=+